MAVLVRYAPQPLPGRPHVRLGENENGVIAPEDAHDIEGEGGGVGAGEHRAPVYQLGLHRGELLQQLQAPVQERLDNKERKFLWNNCTILDIQMDAFF
jgi:hypothetical protein